MRARSSGSGSSPSPRGGGRGALRARARTTTVASPTTGSIQPRQSAGQCAQAAHHDAGLLDRLEVARVDVEDSETVPLGLAPSARHPPGTRAGQRALAELPVRGVKLRRPLAQPPCPSRGCHRQGCHHPPRSLTNTSPPSSQPHWRAHGLVVTSGHPPDSLETDLAAVFDRDHSDPERGCVPGHVGVVPGDPGQPPAWTLRRPPSGRRHEVGAVEEDPAGVRSRRRPDRVGCRGYRQEHELPDGTPDPIPVPLTDRQHPSPVGGGPEVAVVPPLAGRGYLAERTGLRLAWSPFSRSSVNRAPLTGDFGKEHGLVGLVDEGDPRAGRPGPSRSSASSARSPAGGAGRNAPPPYSWTRERTLLPRRSTSRGCSPGTRRMTTCLPPSRGRFSTQYRHEPSDRNVPRDIR